MSNYVIIVAGGSGSRMKSNIPKQFLLLEGEPVLMHTIRAFHTSGIQPTILLVLSEAFQDHWKELCRVYKFDIPHQIVPGGEQRFHSVKNAIDLVPENSLVAIHDAVRPVITASLIKRCFEVAKSNGTCIPVTASRDSLRKRSGLYSVAINREEILIVQTPQVFQSSIVKKAYMQQYEPSFTDDASVVEKAGFDIALTEGDLKNLKITYPEDLQMAALFIKQMN